MIGLVLHIVLVVLLAAYMLALLDDFCDVVAGEDEGPGGEPPWAAGMGLPREGCHCGACKEAERG